MTKNELLKTFDECLKSNMGIRIETSISNQEPEIVIYNVNALMAKKSYYNKNYDDNLVFKKNKAVRIVDVRPIRIKRHAKEITMFVEV